MNVKQPSNADNALNWFVICVAFVPSYTIKYSLLFFFTFTLMAISGNILRREEKNSGK